MAPFHPDISPVTVAERLYTSSEMLQQPPTIPEQCPARANCEGLWCLFEFLVMIIFVLGVLFPVAIIFGTKLLNLQMRCFGMQGDVTVEGLFCSGDERDYRQHCKGCDDKYCQGFDDW